MKYLNEHPQVTAWREKCEKLVCEFDTIVDAMNNQKLYIQELEKYVKELEDKCKAETRRADGNYIEYKNLCKEFSRLPWYKRLFYKKYY